MDGDDTGPYTAVAVCGGDADHTIVYGGELSHTMTPTGVADWLASLADGSACKAAPRNPKSGVTLDHGIVRPGVVGLFAPSAWYVSRK